jgi:hypothetical protein
MRMRSLQIQPILLLLFDSAVFDLAVAGQIIAAKLLDHLWPWRRRPSRTLAKASAVKPSIADKRFIALDADVQPVRVINQAQ